MRYGVRGVSDRDDVEDTVIDAGIATAYTCVLGSSCWLRRHPLGGRQLVPTRVASLETCRPTPPALQLTICASACARDQKRLPTLRCDCIHLPLRNDSVDGVATDMSCPTRTTPSCTLAYLPSSSVCFGAALAVLLTKEDVLVTRELRAKGVETTPPPVDNMGGLEVSLFVLSKRFSVRPSVFHRPLKPDASS
eukprot:TRINITY_DN5863_c0_g1_i5.p1 TRINITY_DN5863_c0_g1~~TRINITY_DN5863_c0_g1_i5.p1  ORF type:complete len:193 (-),score=9.84 TRINITY_DN5863_c0_g1_i5:166-744(-)